MSDDNELLERRAEALVEGHIELMKRLIAMRAKHHLTQDEVAERMGVSQPTVAAFERYDSNPTLSTIRRYAMAVEARIEHEVVDDCHGPISAAAVPDQPVWAKAPVQKLRWSSKHFEFKVEPEDIRV